MIETIAIIVLLIGVCILLFQLISLKRKNELMRLKLEASSKKIKDITNELHTEVGHELLLLQNVVPAEGQVIVKDVSIKIRNISHKYDQTIWENNSLKNALALFNKKIETHSNFIVLGDFDLVLVDVNNEIKQDVRLIMQELTANTLKYCKGKSIKYSIEIKDDNLHLQYKDFGDGEKPKLSLNMSGIGLNLIKSIAKVRNGKTSFTLTEKGFVAEVSLKF